MKYHYAINIQIVVKRKKKQEPWMWKNIYRLLNKISGYKTMYNVISLCFYESVMFLQLSYTKESMFVGRSI